jgi:hypothetical protein
MSKLMVGVRATNNANAAKLGGGQGAHLAGSAPSVSSVAPRSGSISKQDSEQRPGHPEADEWPAPVITFGEPACAKTTHDGTRVDAGLVKAERPGTSAWSVIVAHHGERSRKVQTLAKAHRAAQNGQAPEPAGESRCGADPAPKLKAADDRGFAAHAIYGIARKWRGQAICPGERGAQQAQFGEIEMKTRLQKRKDREDGLTVGIVEETDDPEYGDKQPAIGRSWGGLRLDERNTASRLARDFPQHESRKGEGLSTEKHNLVKISRAWFQISIWISLF